MPLVQELLDLNLMFRQLAEPPIIINDLSNNTDEAREMVKEIITTRYSSDQITLIPSCRCGLTKGEFSKPHTCIHCKGPVRSVMADTGDSAVWFRKPAKVVALINPEIWMMLTDKFKKGRYSLLNWIIDTKYNPNTKVPTAILQKMIDAGIQQGYNYFCNNFDRIMEVMFSIRDFQTKPKYGNDPHARLYELIKRERHKIFCDYLPIPNKSLMIIQKTVFSTYVDNIITNAVDAIQMLVSIDRDYHDQSERSQENRTARGFNNLCLFYYSYLADHVASKEGQIRRHGLGARTNFSGRAVITSINHPHRDEELEPAWGMGLVLFREHLVNKLMKLGMSLNNCISLLWSHTEKYHPLLDRLVKEIISEFPGGRVPVLLNRNQLGCLR